MEGKRENKIYLIGVALFALALSAFCIWAYAVERIDVEKSIPCREMNSGTLIDVTVSGTYYLYKYRDDHFIGTIRIPGYRECTCDYTFKHDNTSYFVDEAGQPMGSIQQSGIFESIKVSENNYNLVSE